MTAAEKQQIISEVLAALRGQADSVPELREVETLDGVNSLPGYINGEMVVVPIEQLSAPAPV